MRRPYRTRVIDKPPHIRGFKPLGRGKRSRTKIKLSLDEYEAVRLADFLGMEHLHAAEKMGISRPTFTRLIEKARYKIAAALIDGLELSIAGGNIEFKNTLRKCLDCGDESISPFKKRIAECSECGSSNFEDLAALYLDESNEKEEE